MRRGFRFLALAAGLAAASCATIRLRDAMNTVERRKAILFDEFENGAEFAVRDAARELESALSVPAITLDSPHASDPEYRKLLGEAIDTVRRIRDEPSFHPDGPARFRSELLATCNGACHERFKPGS
jgi:hypothetical protein